MKSLVLWAEENGDRWRLLPRLRVPVMRTSILCAIVALGVSVAVAEDFVSQSNEATAAVTSSATQTKCDTSDDQNIPVGSTIEAKVTGSLDSAHLKPGKEITAQVVS